MEFFLEALLFQVLHGMIIFVDYAREINSSLANRLGQRREDT